MIADSRIWRNNLKPLILLEFNELCEVLINKWITEGELPNFKKLRQSADQFRTHADAAPPALEPWIQWYSLHTGLSYDEHKVFSLTDGQNQTHADIWEDLQKQGFPTFNCGSMNTKKSAVPGSIYIPDPWCTDSKPFPETLYPYYDFVSDQVQNQSARRGLLSKFKLSFNFLTFMLANGLTLKTISKTVSQLYSEKLSKKEIYWKRAFILDWLQTDLFIATFNKYQPKFSTFFLNSTAHTQHSYWKFLEPEKFGVDLKSTEYLNHKDAVLDAYKNMDKLLGRFIDFAGDKVSLALATGLSQKAFIKDDAYQVYYRFHDANTFTRALGFKQSQIKAVMTHQYIFHSENTQENHRFEKILAETTFKNGTSVFDFNIKENGAIYLGTYITREVAEDEIIVVDNKEVVFSDLFYKINESKSGCHHPEGIFWIQRNNEPASRIDLPVIQVNGVIKDYFSADPT